MPEPVTAANRTPAEALQNAADPVVDAGTSPAHDGAATADGRPPPGMGLCLSGGGYRAMLFHLGALWRLNELGVLYRLNRISSVSGGSITAAVLGLKWSQLTWQSGVTTDFDTHVVAPVRRLASHTIDRRSIVRGVLQPGTTVGDRVAVLYRKHLFGDATLQDLPDDANGAPRFVINATNVQTGALCRFSRPYLADWRIGRWLQPRMALAEVVSASSAFPPVLSPVRLTLPKGALEPTLGADLHREPFTTRLVLTDGGVYDNLGLETVWKRYDTVLISDGGGQMEAEADPPTDWARHALRINALIDNQVRALRKRQVVGSLQAGLRRGAYWRTRSDIAAFPAPDALACPPARTLLLAQTPTRLKALDDTLQERLINWGYALADAAVRGYVEPGLHAPPSSFPYPSAGI
jgi:NTE family protein